MSENPQQNLINPDGTIKMPEAQVAPPPTFGEGRVRTSFNITKDDLVTKIKNKTAELIDLCQEAKKEALAREDKNQEWKGETARLYAQAQTEYESAGHWAVKGATAHL